MTMTVNSSNPNDNNNIENNRNNFLMHCSMLIVHMCTTSKSNYNEINKLNKIKIVYT